VSYWHGGFVILDISEPSLNEPFATLLIEQAGGVRVASMDKLKPHFPAGYLLYGTSLTKTNREAGRRYMIAYLRGLHDYKLAFGPEKKNTADVVALLEKYNMNITPETPSMGVPVSTNSRPLTFDA
jgi:NitT/TauT family transport system substrate-binding protein